MLYRYLAAYLGAREPDRMVLLRFPPGVTLEDAGRDWASLVLGAGESPLPAGAVGRLRRLGVEVVAKGERAAFEALRRAGAESLGLEGDFAEDYLGVNARLGGGRCVTIAEYAMHTRVGEQPLRVVLRERLGHLALHPRASGIRAYGDVVFRARDLPRLLRLHFGDFALRELYQDVPVFVPCRLHSDECRGYPRTKHNPGLALYHAADQQHTRARVEVPRRLLEEMHEEDEIRVARAGREIVRRVLDALPDGAWRNDRPSWDLESVVAAAVAATCEEYKMLAQTLMECGSAHEVVRRARDASWVVSRALEGLS